MIPKAWLDAQRAAGVSDTEIIAKWTAIEAEAVHWPDAAAVQARFGRSRQSVALWCRRGLFDRAGEIGAVMVDRQWRVNPDALETFTPPVEGAGGGRPKRKGAK